MKPTLIVLLGALSLIACSDSKGPTVQDEQMAAAFEALPPETNILFITFDALRADALGVYGNQKNLSPNIDQWAKRAFVFDQFYVAGQATPSSFAASFTGQYPFRVFRKWNLMETQTLAKVMEKAGRDTFGLFHNVQLIDDRNFGQGFEEYEAFSGEEEEHVLERAGELLEAHREGPFFGWIHFISPHAPYDHRDVASHLYSEDYEGPYEETTGPRPHPDEEDDIERLKELYNGEVFYLDTLFQGMLETLDRLELSENTIVIMTSDHGEQFNEHGDFGHNSLYEEIVRVPLIIRAPGYEGERAHVEHPHSNVDLLPTLAEFAGSDFAEISDGVNMLEPHDPERPLLLTAMTNKDHRAMAVRQGNDKLIVACPPPEFEEILFDLDEDPQEHSNRVLDDPKRTGELFDLMSETAGGKPCEVIQDAVRGADISDNLDEETIEKLKSLGYIQ